MLQTAVERFIKDRQSYCSTKTVESYRQILTEMITYFADRPLPSITADDLRAYLTHLRSRPSRRGGKLSAAYVHDHVRGIKTFFRWCVTSGILGADPSVALRPPRYKREPKALTPEQVQQVVAALESGTWPSVVRDRALLYFMLDSGCRAAEVCALHLESMDLRARRAEIVGKGDKSRTVAFGTRAAHAMRAYLKKRSEGYAFLSDEGTPLTYAGLRQILRRLSERTGFHLSAHMLRHTFGTLSALNGVDPSHIQVLMGHADPQTTQIYMEAAKQIAALRAAKSIVD